MSNISKEAPSLKYYIVKRILEAIPIIIIIIVFNFILIHASPGSPVSILAGEMATPEYIEQITRDLGLDQPIHVQLFLYLGNILRGNLGYSFIYKEPVLDLILQRLPATLLLMFSVVVLSAIIGVIFGVISSTRVHSTVDNTATIVSLFGYAMPLFWSGQLLLLIFALYLDWFPASGMIDLRAGYTGLLHYLDILHHAILPIANLTFLYLALIFRLTRANMLDVLAEDYIVTARAKGLRERIVVFKHALRNALLPVVTVIGSNFGLMLGGAILTETIFNWPGIGKLVHSSIYSRDFPVLMGVFTIVAIMVIITNIITDIVYSFLDPRIRYH